jgi:hypothetical protein
MQVRPASAPSISACPAVPACPRCEGASTSIALQTAYAFYCRCQSCGEVWSLPRTSREQQRP